MVFDFCRFCEHKKEKRFCLDAYCASRREAFIQKSDAIMNFLIDRGFK